MNSGMPASYDNWRLATPPHYEDDPIRVEVRRSRFGYHWLTCSHCETDERHETEHDASEAMLRHRCWND
jgi:hypothetical protein